MKRNLWIMYAIALLQGMVFYGPIATLYRQAHGLTIFQITLIESISLALLILLEIPWGIIADKIGCRHTIIFCSALYLISKIIFWKADGFAGFLGCPDSQREKNRHGAFPGHNKKGNEEPFAASVPPLSPDGWESAAPFCFFAAWQPLPALPWQRPVWLFRLRRPS